MASDLALRLPSHRHVGVKSNKRLYLQCSVMMTVYLEYSFAKFLSLKPCIYDNNTQGPENLFQMELYFGKESKPFLKFKLTHKLMSIQQN